jgi:polysaccharide pyruvyl transferase WcaK-like protein
LGGYGVHNVGDEAILAGLLNLIPTGVNVCVVSRDPSATTRVHGVSAVSPMGAMAALIRSSVLIVGGGGIFSGHMGLMGKLIPVFSLLARAKRMRVAFVSVGVYPSTPRWVGQSLKRLVPLLTSFTVRDRVSVRTLESWGITVRRVPDLSSFMPVAPSERGAEILASMGLDVDVPTIGLCLTSTEPKLERALVQSIPPLIASVSDTQFCFVPMSLHPTVSHHNDLALAHRIRSLSPDLVVLEDEHHPSEIAALFQHFTSVVCMRYHSLLFAERTATSVVPIPYAEKCWDWTEEQGLEPVEASVEALSKRINGELVRFHMRKIHELHE